MKHLKQLIALLLALLLCLFAVTAPAEGNRTWDADGLKAYLNELAKETKDEWQKAIYQAGAENLTEENGTLTFLLRGFSPDIKNLPKQKEDPNGWLEGFFANVAAYRLEASLAIENGVPAKASENKLKNAVKNAAVKAKEAFNQKTVKNALLDLLFPVPYQDAAAFKQGALSPEFNQWLSWMGMGENHPQALSALMYAQTSRQMNLSKGPHALEISVRSVAPAALLSEANRAAIEKISKVAQANAMRYEELSAYFENELVEVSGTLRKKPADKQVFSVDVDQLAERSAGEAYDAFLTGFTVGEAADQFETAVRDLPDYPALDYPKNGRISGNTSGTKIIIKVPKDGFARYIQVRSVSTDHMLVDLFILPGGSATVRAPQGMVYLLIAMGKTWYGEEALFGEDSILSRTDDIEIKSARYYHTITLGGVANGNLKSWSVDEGSFKK